MWTLREYRYARSAAQAVALLRQGPGKGRYIAGGTDLLLAPPADCDFVVDINGAGLDEIVRTASGDLFLGATAPLQKIATSSLVVDHAAGAVAAAARHCGNRPVRTVATIGGNLCHAVPSADMAPILLALDASTHFTDGQQQQSLALQDFFTGPKATVLGDRLLVGVSLPRASAGWRAASWKLTRTAEDISLVHVAVALDVHGSRVQAAGIALGAVAPVPRRADAAERLLLGLDLGGDTAATTIADAAQAAAACAEPISDHRASATYRRAMVAVMTRRLLNKFRDDVQGAAA
jgi:carbon-monoxide dehydrogenase medium subunit